MTKLNMQTILADIDQYEIASKTANTSRGGYNGYHFIEIAIVKKDAAYKQHRQTSLVCPLWESNIQTSSKLGMQRSDSLRDEKVAEFVQQYSIAPRT